MLLMQLPGSGASQSGMFEETPSWQRNPAVTGIILLAMLISPIGAPFLGLIAIEVCDIPWEGAYQCPVPDTVLTYFWVSLWGPFFMLGLFALVWFAISIGLLIRFGWLFVSALLCTFAER